MPEKKSYRLFTIDEATDILLEKKNTLILCHARPDCDAIGSAAALKQLLVLCGMKAYCICADEIPHRLEFLPVKQKSFLAESIPEDMEIERVVTVDTASPAQLGTLADEYLDKICLMIDHHSKGEQYADGCIDSIASATGELIYEISRRMLTAGAIKKVPEDIDTCLYAAISSDTGCFRFSSATPKTHRIAAELLEAGVASGEINHMLYDSKPFMQLKAEMLGFENMKLYFGGRVSVIEFPYMLGQENGIESQYTDTLVDVARSVEGVGVAAVIKQPSEANAYRCSMRSSCPVDVSRICAAFGGGGHAKASGCTIEAESIGKATELVLAEIEKAFLDIN